MSQSDTEALKALVESNAPLRTIRKWDKEDLYIRLDRCCTLLSINGCLTHSEREKVRDRIQKNLSSGRYHEVEE